MFTSNPGRRVGITKWFDDTTKGFGFIQPDDGGNDAFVHISAVERAGMASLREGQKVEYELVTGRNGKQAAENLVALGTAFGRFTKSRKFVLAITALDSDPLFISG